MTHTVADADRSLPRLRAGVTLHDGELARLRFRITVRPAEVWPWIQEIAAGPPRTPRELARTLGADLSDVLNLCQRLNDVGYLWLAPPDGSVTLHEFKTEFRLWVRHWVRRMFAHPVWEDVRKGAAGPAVLVGWVKENMHYTGSVIRHMTRAAAFAEDTREGRTLLTHNSQEWDHYALFRDACASVGLPAADVQNSRPLRSTVAITHLMRRIARRDPLVYNACEAMLEATAERPARVVEFFETVREHYDYPRALIDPLIEHLHVDEEFEHIDIFDGLVADMTSMPFQLLTEIMNACNELAETMHLWHAEIACRYQPLTSPQQILNVS